MAVMAKKFAAAAVMMWFASSSCPVAIMYNSRSNTAPFATNTIPKSLWYAEDASLRSHGSFQRDFRSDASCCRFLSSRTLSKEMQLLWQLTGCRVISLDWALDKPSGKCAAFGLSTKGVSPI